MILSQVSGSSQAPKCTSSVVRYHLLRGLHVLHSLLQGGNSGRADQKFEEAKQKAAEAVEESVRDTVGSDSRASGGQKNMASQAYDAAADTVYLLACLNSDLAVQSASANLASLVSLNDSHFIYLGHLHMLHIQCPHLQMVLHAELLLPQCHGTTICFFCWLAGRHSEGQDQGSS